MWQGTGLPVGSKLCGYHQRRQGIDGYYVDGLSLTHGAPGSRQNIWTFASGLFTGCHSSIHPYSRCLWVATIFVRVHEQSVIGVLMIDFASIQMLNSGMVRFVRVVAHVANSTICHGLPKPWTFLPMIVLSCGCACKMVVPSLMWH